MTATVGDGFYEDAGSLFVEAYDAIHASDLPQIAGDIAFYKELAGQCGDRVLELACGTGRIAVPLAAAGVKITAVDASAGMLGVARRKAAALATDRRQCLTFDQQDMTALDLDHTYGLIFVAFRSFQHLLTMDLQIKTLEAIGAHLKPQGKVALNLFDPRLDLLVDENAAYPSGSETDSVSGKRYTSEITQTRFDHLAQIRRDLWRYAEIDSDGAAVREETREMALRWTYRYELHHLLARCGFSVDAEYSDFQKSAPTYGKELIVVAHRG